jgi:hypothetical protein
MDPDLVYKLKNIYNRGTRVVGIHVKGGSKKITPQLSLIKQSGQSKNIKHNH